MDAWERKHSAAETCGYPHVHTNGNCTLAMTKRGYPIEATRIRAYLRRYRPDIYAQLPPKEK
jgi:hypothetical protein